MTMEELAHYGRWFPDEGYPSPLWWFDARRGEMLPVEAVCRACGCERAEDLDVEACKAVDIIPCFQVDIPSLERKYARAHGSGAMLATGKQSERGQGTPLTARCI